MRWLRDGAVGGLALAVLAACGATGSVRGGGTTPRLATAGGARRVLALTDLEEARDVASAPSATFVATDSGLLVYPSTTESEGGPPREPGRITRAEGLPSDDVTAVALDADGTALVATAAGLARVQGQTASAVADVPPHARAMDLVVTRDGTAWLCTLSGLLRRQGGTWARFGDPFQCTTLAPTPEGQLWVGSTSGVLYVEGDVVREHPVSGGIPEGYVRSIVPVLPGQILALVNGPQRAQLAFWDGSSWYGYTLPGLEEPVVGLAMRGGADATLVTRDRAFAIAPTGGGTAFRALGATPGNVRSFRATTSTDATPPAEVDASRALRGPQPLADVPQSGPTVRAPTLIAIPLALDLPGGMYRALQSGEHAFAAVGNGGLVELPRRGAPRALRSRSLVPETDLQTATETRGGVWVRARSGEIAKWVEGRLRRLQLPDEVAPQAIASGPRGAYLAALERGTATVRIFVSESGSWRPFLSRTLEVQPTAIPFMGVDPQGRIWLAIEITREDGVGTRTRGAAVLDPNVEIVVYHHRAAPQGQGLPLPDEISAMTFDGDGNAWFASLSGAVRVEEHQAIVFDETRGVRGEVVTDVASGSGRMWIAAAEGLGSYADREFDFHQPAIVREHRPSALATDASGHLWAAGSSGLLQYDGSAWALLGSADGLPTESLEDVEVDGAGRVWLLADDAVIVLLPPGE